MKHALFFISFFILSGPSYSYDFCDYKEQKHHTEQNNIRPIYYFIRQCPNQDLWPDLIRQAFSDKALCSTDIWLMLTEDKNSFLIDTIFSLKEQNTEQLKELLFAPTITIPTSYNLFLNFIKTYILFKPFNYSNILHLALHHGHQVFLDNFIEHFPYLLNESFLSICYQSHQGLNKINLAEKISLELLANNSLLAKNTVVFLLNYTKKTNQAIDQKLVPLINQLKNHDPSFIDDIAQINKYLFHDDLPI